jgi:hypothetical protein
MNYSLTPGLDTETYINASSFKVVRNTNRERFFLRNYVGGKPGSGIAGRLRRISNYTSGKGLTSLSLELDNGAYWNEGLL